ncbi:putative E3 ubiquitin-protein ligase MARCH [Helianthus anomalus]
MDPLHFFFFSFFFHKLDFYSSSNPRKTKLQLSLSPSYRHRQDPLSVPLCFIDPSFAHRKCIQKCCNKKGHITCMHCGPQIDRRDAHFLPFASENQFLEPDYEDYGVGINNNIAYLRFMDLIVSEKQVSCHKFYKRSYKLISVCLN